MEEKIAKALKEWLETHGHTQDSVSDALGVSVQFVNMLLNGKKTIGKKLADRISNHYGLSKAFLLTGEGDIENKPVVIDEKLRALHDDAIQKSNRFVAALGYLVDEGKLSNYYAVAPRLCVTESVIRKAINYDPDGQVDFAIIKLCDVYPELSLMWIMTGEGTMLLDNRYSIDEYIDSLKARIESQEREIRRLESDIEQRDHSLKDKDDIIANQKAKIVSLEAELAARRANPLYNHPYNLGVADGDNQDVLQTYDSNDKK